MIAGKGVPIATYSVIPFFFPKHVPNIYTIITQRMLCMLRAHIKHIAIAGKALSGYKIQKIWEKNILLLSAKPTWSFIINSDQLLQANNNKKLQALPVKPPLMWSLHMSTWHSCTFRTRHALNMNPVSGVPVANGTRPSIQDVLVKGPGWVVHCTRFAGTLPTGFY